MNQDYQKIPKLLLILVLSYTIIGTSVYAEKKNKNTAATVSYTVKFNGKSRGNGPSLILRYANQTVLLDRPSEFGSHQTIPGMAKEVTYLDYRKKKSITVATLEQKEPFHSEKSFDQLDKLNFTGQTDTILGYTCKLAKMDLRSNRMEIWYTEEAGITGSPSPATANAPGLVLKVVRNGNFETIATKIEFSKPEGKTGLIPENLGELVSEADYQARLKEALVQTVTVFKDEQLNWTESFPKNQKIQDDIKIEFAGGTVALRKVKLPDTADNQTIFAEVSQRANGDAYDRTGSIFIVPTDSVQSFLDGIEKGIDCLPKIVDKKGKDYQGMKADKGYLPLVEMVRFFTPFGVNHFNDKVTVKGQVWADSSYFKQDVTELKPYLCKEAWIGAYIGNYDKGGHIVNLRLKYYPEGQSPEKKKEQKHWQMPLFNTLNVMEMAGQNYPAFFETDSLSVTFTVPENVKNLQLRYISTGHGGWGGGDEFNQKVNKIFIDGQLAFSFTPWRSDCAVYRNLNPASGNFWNGLSSSDLSRSGWCPGTLTNPVFIPLLDLKPGVHTLKVAIPQGAAEGTSSSAWNVSGILLGEM